MILVLAQPGPMTPTREATARALCHTPHRWVSPKEASPALLEGAQGLWVGPGAPHEPLERSLEMIHAARHRGIPGLGTCQGFQLMALELARHELGVVDAMHQEYGGAGTPFITPSVCMLRGQELPVQLDAPLVDWYGATVATERYYCTYEIAPDHIARVRSSGVHIPAWGPDGDPRVLTWPEHRFWTACLFVPQMQPEHPIVRAFLRAAT